MNATYSRRRVPCTGRQRTVRTPSNPIVSRPPRARAPLPCGSLLRTTAPESPAQYRPALPPGAPAQAAQSLPHRAYPTRWGFRLRQAILPYYLPRRGETYPPTARRSRIVVPVMTPEPPFAAHTRPGVSQRRLRQRIFRRCTSWWRQTTTVSGAYQQESKREHNRQHARQVWPHQ